MKMKIFSFDRVFMPLTNIGCHGTHYTNGRLILSIYSVIMDRNANAYSELFYHCVQVLNEYTDKISEETFLEQYFQEHKVNKFRHGFFLSEKIAFDYSRFPMNRLYLLYYSIVYVIRLYSKRSSRFSTQPKEPMFENPNRIFTKV